MKNVLIIIILCLANQAYCQNWAPFYIGDTANYEADTSALLKYTIWVDSVTHTGSDTTFHLNRIAVPCPNCQEYSLLGNQAQFLGLRIHALDNGKYYFEAKKSFTLLALADSGDSWVWDTTNMTTAHITEIKEDSVFEVIDSIKTISLSNGTKIVLSKKYGIIQFPETPGSNHSVNLSGIENRNLGQKMFDFWDIFDFDIGTIFYHLQWSSTSQLPSDGYETKREIIDRRVYGDSLVYDVSWKSIYTYTAPWPHNNEIKYYSSGQGEWTFVNKDQGISIYDEIVILNDFQPNNVVNAYNNQLVSFEWDTNNFARVSINENEKKWRFHHQFSSPNSDTLIWGNNSIHSIWQTYKKGLGETEFRSSYGESANGRFLLGYIKDGQTFGTIIPEDSFVNPIEKPIEPGAIRFFPNPAHETIEIEVNDQQYLPASLCIRDLQGRVIYHQQISQNHEAITLQKLPQNWYLIEIIEKSGKILRDKILIMNH